MLEGVRHRIDGSPEEEALRYSPTMARLRRRFCDGEEKPECPPHLASVPVDSDLRGRASRQRCTSWPSGSISGTVFTYVPTSPDSDFAIALQKKHPEIGFVILP